MLAVAELAPHVGLRSACQAFALNRGFVYRDRAGHRVTASRRVPRARPRPPLALPKMPQTSHPGASPLMRSGGHGWDRRMARQPFLLARPYGSDHRGRERIRQAVIAPIVHMQLVRIEKLFVAEMPLVPEPHQLEPAS